MSSQTLETSCLFFYNIYIYMYVCFVEKNWKDDWEEKDGLSEVGLCQSVERSQRKREQYDTRHLPTTTTARATSASNTSPPPSPRPLPNNNKKKREKQDDPARPNRTPCTYPQPPFLERLPLHKLLIERSLSALPFGRRVPGHGTAFRLVPVGTIANAAGDDESELDLLVVRLSKKLVLAREHIGKRLWGVYERWVLSGDWSGENSPGRKECQRPFG